METLGASQIDIQSFRPQVTLVPEELESDVLQRQHISICFEGKEIGSFSLARTNIDPHATIAMVTISGDYRGRGIGKAAYLQLLKYLADIPLRSGLLNQNSTRVWESLVRDGLAAKGPFVSTYGSEKYTYTSLPEAVRTHFSDSTG